MITCKVRPSTLLLGAALLILVTGCDSSSSTPTAAEKKAFLGGPMPAGFMDKVNAGQKAAQDKAAKAAAAAAAQHGQ